MSTLLADSHRQECLSYFSYVIYFSRCDEMKPAISEGIPFL